MSTVKRRVRMGKRVMLWGLLAALLVVSGVAAGSVLPQAVERSRHVIAGGGTSATVGSVTLRATLGQPFVGSSANGSVRLGHGFWGGGAAAGYTVYLPLVLKNQS